MVLIIIALMMLFSLLMTYKEVQDLFKRQITDYKTVIKMLEKANISYSIEDRPDGEKSINIEDPSRGIVTTWYFANEQLIQIMNWN